MKLRDIPKHAVVAAALHVSEGAVSRWCQGSPMTLGNIVSLCRYLDVSADWLILGRGHMDQHRQTAVAGVDPATLLHGLPEPARTHLLRFLEEVGRVP